ncbi:MAG: CCA tRNA nucleotidyltransferase [Acetobacteraceae bacterium]|nr:CCA tRNA nucleotidyltransferase [Acetobacteraceae bacterium]
MFEPALAALLDALPEARVVGGAVRDALAGRPASDVDLASPLLPETVIERLTPLGVKVVPTGLAHGTVTAVLPDRHVEITTLRLDVETDGRRATVAFTSDWRADAARRDFTINAMSMTRNGAVFDYFDGLADLRAGRLRFVGDPASRVAEDYLRVLRFFRFFARHGGTEPDPATQTALRDAAPHLRGLSAERVWSELTLILSAPDPRTSVASMEQLGVLGAVIPEGTDLPALSHMIAKGAPVDPVLRIASLLTGDPLAFAARLKLSLAERDRLLALRGAPLAAPDADDATLRRLLADTGASVLIDRTWLSGGDGAAWDQLRLRLRATPKPVFPLEGGDIVALGVPPGPRIGALSRAVRTWWLEGGCAADTAACRDEARRLIRDGTI